MDLSVLNRVCWTICLVCIVTGAAFSLFMIWTPVESEILWKAWSSMGVLFFASAATLVVSKSVGKSVGKKEESV